MSVINSYSQNDSLIIIRQGLTYQVSFRYINLSNLNNALIENGFNNFKKDNLGISLGITSRIIDEKSYMSSLLNYSKIESLNDDNSKKATIDVFEIAIESQRIISNSPKWLFYPYFGFGCGYSRMKLTEKIINFDFNESISNLSTSEENVKNYFLKNPLFYGNIGLGIDRKLKIFGDDFYIGYSLGYKFSTKSDWGYKESPRLSFGGLEFKVKIRVEYNEKYKNKKPKLFEW
jgi:hypothetical protein